MRGRGSFSGNINVGALVFFFFFCSPQQQGDAGTAGPIRVWTSRGGADGCKGGRVLTGFAVNYLTREQE